MEQPGKLINQPINKSINQPINQPVNTLGYQPVNANDAYNNAINAVNTGNTPVAQASY